MIARSAAQAIALVEARGMPSFVSFDHDLGLNADGSLAPSGHDFAKWLIEEDLSGRRLPDEFEFVVHSANPVGKKNIEGLLRGYLQQRSVA
jgi:hypothetical protein